MLVTLPPNICPFTCLPHNLQDPVMLVFHIRDFSAVAITAIASALAAKLGPRATFAINTAAVTPFSLASTFPVVFATAAVGSVPPMARASAFVADSRCAIVAIYRVSHIAMLSTARAKEAVRRTRNHHKSRSPNCSTVQYWHRCKLRSCAAGRICHHRHEQVRELAVY